MLQRLAICGLRSALRQQTRSVASLAVAASELSGASCPRLPCAPGHSTSANSIQTCNLPFGLQAGRPCGSPAAFHDRLFSAVAAAAANGAAPKASAATRTASPKPARKKTPRSKVDDPEATARAIVAAARKAAAKVAEKVKTRAKAEAARAKAKERKEREKEAQRAKKEAEKARKAAKERVPRPPSAFNLYLQDHLLELRASGKLPKPASRAQVKEAFAAAAKQFKELPASQRQPYMDRAAAAKAKTAAVRAERKAERAAKVPPTTYMLYYKEQFPALRKAHPELKVVEIASRIAVMWRTADEATLKRLTDAANVERAARGFPPLPVKASAAAPAAAKAAPATPAAMATPAAAPSATAPSAR